VSYASAGIDIYAAPDLPWAPERSRAAVRGRIVIRVAPGSAPDHAPDAQSVARGFAVPASRLDLGKIDQVLQKFSPAMQVTTAFRPAQLIGGGGGRWDDIEHATGLSRTFKVDIDPDASLVDIVAALSDLESVEQASPQYLSVTPFTTALADVDERAAVTPPTDVWYAHRLVGAAEALAIEPGDRALIVGIVDSGVDLGHDEFRDRLRPGLDVVDLPADGVPRSMTLVGDWSGIDRNPQDEVGHGTACAGIIGARGYHLPPGLGGPVPLLAVRVLAAARMVGRATLTAIGALTDIDRGLKEAIDLGARVLNLSFGTPESALRAQDPRPHADIVAYARRRGCVLVAASGNSGDTTRYYPACLDGVIAVGAVNEESQPSKFMTRGDHVDLCAPGERIPSAGIGGYQMNTGTSFAAPFVSAASALLLAHAARYSHPLDAPTVRDLLMRTAKPFPRKSAAEGCGAGILDVPAALRALEAEVNDEERPRPGDHPDTVPGAPHLKRP
jgi:subtilisin family serine protease